MNRNTYKRVAASAFLLLPLMTFMWGFWPALHAKAQDKNQEYVFVVEIPPNLTPGEPITVKAESRLMAVAKLGLTVYTKEEWLDSCGGKFDKSGQAVWDQSQCTGK